MSPEVARRRRQLALRLAAAALVWSVGLLVSAVAVPLYDGQTTSDASGLTISSATYVERFGGWILIPLVLPAAAALLGLTAVAQPGPVSRRAAVAGTALTALAGVVFVLSGGAVLLPVAILVAIALRIAPRGVGTAVPPVL